MQLAEQGNVAQNEAIAPTGVVSALGGMTETSATRPTITKGTEMANGDIRTYYEDGEWKSKVDGSSRAAHVGGTKAEQSSMGRDMARERGVEHRITRTDGAVTQQNSYGSDPESSKG